MDGWMDTKSREGATQTKINQATTTWTIDEEKKTNAKKNINKKNYNEKCINKRTHIVITRATEIFVFILTV